MLIIPAMFLFAGCSSKDNIDIRISDGYVQWSYEGEDNWVNIISVDDIKETLGENYKGEAGTNGREIELRKQGGYLQWRYVGESTWKSLAGDMYTISFDSQGGTSVESITDIPENTKVQKPTDPTRDGYLFDGWYYQNEKWSFIGYTVSENITLTAHWNPIFNLENNKILSLTPYASTLKTLNIPSTIDGVEITEIDDNAFANNLMLEKVVISDSIKKIDYAVFSGCSNITIFEGANNVEECSDYVFNDTKWYQTQKQGDKLITLGSVCLGLGDNFTSTEIVISNKIKYIIPGIFSKRENLTSITIPNSVKNTFVSSSAFSGCTSLTSVIIPNSVKSIGRYAFSGCKSLTSVTIPASVTSIWSYAFEDCSSLTSLTIPCSVANIESFAFKGCSCLTSLKVEEGNEKFHSDGNCIIETNSKTLIAGCKTSIIPDDGSVICIGTNAFANCSGLTSMTVPNSVTNIEEGAFYGCSSLEEITIPFVGGSPTENTDFGYIFGASSYSYNSTYVSSSLKKVNIIGGTNISKYAFYNCSGLTSVKIPNSVTSIGYCAFSGCSGLTSITIPESVTSIDGYAFFDCKRLTSVKIPNSVTAIGDYAFCGCESLASIIVPDSVTDIGHIAFYDCNYLTIYCEATSQPINWSPIWNDSNRPVYWYSETEPTESGNYWHYVDGVVTIW